MKMSKPLDVIKNGTQIYLLRELSIHSDTELTETQLSKLCSCTRQTVSTNLDLLVSEDLVNRRKVGNVNLIKINQDNILSKKIKELFDLETHLKRELVNELKKIFSTGDNNILMVYLFGSVAKGKDSSDSDIDLFVVVKNKIAFDIYDEWFKKIKKLFSKRISVHLNNKKEAEELMEKNSRLLHNIFSEGIWLGGPKRLTLASDNKIAVSDA